MHKINSFANFQGRKRKALDLLKASVDCTILQSSPTSHNLNLGTIKHDKK